MSTDNALFGHPLAYVRHRRGWSAAQFLALVADAAEVELRLRLPRDDRAKVSRWETRGVTPEPAVQRAIARLLGVRAARLAETPWPRWLPAFDGVRPVAAWSPSAAVRALADAVTGATAERRAYLGVSGPPLIAIGRRWLDRRPPPLTGVVRGALRAGEAVLAALESQAALLRSLEEHLPAVRIEALATAHAGLALEHLTASSIGPRAVERLHRAAAAHLTLAGWAAYDGGRHFAAQRHFIAAVHAAQAVGDRALGAYLLMCLGHQAIAVGSPGAGLRLTELAGARVPGGRSRAMLAGYRGLSLIAAGRDPAAVQRGVAARLTHPAAPSTRAESAWVDWFTPRRDAGELRRYLLVEGGRRAVRAVGGGAASPAAGGPVQRTHLLLQQLAEQLLAAPSSAPEVRARLSAHRLYAA